MYFPKAGFELFITTRGPIILNHNSFLAVRSSHFHTRPVRMFKNNIAPGVVIQVPSLFSKHVQSIAPIVFPAKLVPAKARSAESRVCRVGLWPTRLILTRNPVKNSLPACRSSLLVSPHNLLRGLLQLNAEDELRRKNGSPFCNVEMGKVYPA